ncbi:hypothetical protein Sjap_015157 [Stephania japonica]|uniref:Transmembrane protein n=1 Tax=Stephania japonica TaxID=461633 RepID=A0AAP0IJ22_9MAGN
MAFSASHRSLISLLFITVFIIISSIQMGELVYGDTNGRKLGGKLGRGIPYNPPSPQSNRMQHMFPPKRSVDAPPPTTYIFN